MSAERDPDFHDRRATGIGATDSAAILGLSRWGTPLSVYLEKVGEQPPKESTLPMWLGNRLQEVVAELYTAQTGSRLRADNRHHRHPQYDWLVCHLDYRVWGDPDTLVEVKTARSIEGWGAAGTAEVPVDYWVQVQHEMAVTGAHTVHIAVLFGHYDFKVYVVERDQLFIERLIAACDEFWHVHVLARVQPLPSAKDTELVNARHREVREPLAPATVEQLKLVEMYRQAKLNLKQAETRETELKNRLKELIGGRAGLEGAGFRITWYKDEDRIETDWRLVADTLTRVIAELFELASPGDDEVIVARYARLQLASSTAPGIYTQTKTGSRRFLSTFEEEA